METIGRLLDRFTPRGKAVLAVVMLATAMGLGVAIGSSGNTPSTATQPQASPTTTASSPASPTTTASSPAAPATLSLPPGDSSDVTSSTGVDYGADRPRLNGGNYAATPDPEVFAASVRAGMCYDYSTHQPDDVAAEADRVHTMILAGMTGTDGPLGRDIHERWRSAVTRSTDLDRLEWRIRARIHQHIDITKVATLSNDTLHDEVGDETYLAVLRNRHQGIYQYSVTATTTTTVQAVDDEPGWTRTRTSEVHMLVHCPDTGSCTLTAITATTS